MIKIENISKEYKTKYGTNLVLDNISLEFDSFGITSIVGKSGSGKSTLLNIVANIDTQTSGKLFIDGEDTSLYSESDWRNIRYEKIGFVFQRFNLIEHLSVIDNVTLPLIIKGVDKKIAHNRALELLKQVDMIDFAYKRVRILSGGQKQRVAITRSLITNPGIIIADEPTGALDKETGIRIMDILKKFSNERLILLVSHDKELINLYANRVIELENKVVKSDKVINVLKDAKKSDYVAFDKNKSKRVKSYFNVARLNSKNMKSSNYKIITSLIISVLLLVSVNLFISNIMSYNEKIFNINNNYNEFTTDIEHYEKVKEHELVKDVYNNMEYKISEVYYGQDDLIKANSVPTFLDLSNPILKSIPKNENNFYLKDEIIEGKYPVEDNDILLSTEFILNRFLGISQSKEINKRLGVENTNIDLSTFINKEIYICSDQTSDVKSECMKFNISGLINSYYKSVNFSSNIFVKEVGVYNFKTFLIEELLYTSDIVFNDKTSFTLNDFNNHDNIINELEETLNISITNEYIDGYDEYIKFDSFIYNIKLVIIFLTLIIGLGVVISIVRNFIYYRKKEFGIYSSIGMKKIDIYCIMYGEILILLFKCFVIALLFYILMLQSLNYLYNNVVFDFSQIESVYGFNSTFKSELNFFIVTLTSSMFMLVAVILKIVVSVNQVKIIDTLEIN